MKRFHSEHFSQNDLWFPSSGVFLAIAQAEEAGPVPAGSGDLAGDGRQARKDLSLPAEAARDDHNLVQLALIFRCNNDRALHVGGRLPCRPRAAS